MNNIKVVKKSEQDIYKNYAEIISKSSPFVILLFLSFLNVK